MHPTAALGMEYNPFTPHFRENPHAFFERARAEAPVCFNPIFGMWLVTGYAEVMKVCTDTTTFSSGNKVDPPIDLDPEVNRILETEGFPVALQLFNTDPPNHARLRALNGQAFAPEVLTAATPGIRSTVAGMVDEWVHAPETELYSGFTNPMPLRVILDFIGVPRERHADVERWDDWWARLFTSAHAIDEQLEAVREVVAYQQYLNALIDERRATPADDLLSRCVHARRGDYPPLTNAELVWQTMGLLAAGHATTTDALSHLIYQLLSQPDRWAAFRDGTVPVDNLVEEGLRFVNPVLGLPRETTREVSLGGVDLPAGAQVLVSFCSANRDPAFVERPDEFDPLREDPRKHVGFGWGVHTCIGARLSKIIMTAALEELRDRAPGLTLAPEHELQYTEHPFLWGIAQLWVRPGAR